VIQKNSKLGILLMVLATSIFAIQDGISRYLASEYNVMMVVMVRYWFFALFVTLIASQADGGVKKAFSTTQPFLQFFRGTLLAVEVCVIVLAFTFLGLVESHAIFACYPLLAAALSVPILGEKVGWRRWLAIGIGFIGVLIILQPGIKIFSPYALLAIASASMFALYSLLTRYASIKDEATTSFFWTGVSGAVIMTCLGLWYWEPLASKDYSWMILLCISAVLGHYLLIKCYEAAEVSIVQPFAYFQLLFVTIIGISIFSEELELRTLLGAVIIIGAGLFTLYRSNKANS
jgi:drug/metabolite transporter (DMT)-like permease